jgi:hypothetical protein
MACYRLATVDVHLPPSWPEAVDPPGSETFEASAVAFPVKLICSARPSVGSGQGLRRR